LRLKLKLSTAKMIVKKFRDDGIFFEKKFVTKSCSASHVIGQKPEDSHGEVKSQLNSELIVKTE
jgi:hypothetical protein